MKKIGTFGEITFLVNDEKILNFEGFTRETASTYENHALIGQKPRTEFVAPGLDTVSFTVLLKAQFGVSPRDEMNKWVEYARSGDAFFLVIGGKPLGADKWVVTNVSQHWDTVLNEGELISGKIDVTLQEYMETKWTVKGYHDGLKKMAAQKSNYSAAKGNEVVEESVENNSNTITPSWINSSSKETNILPLAYIKNIPSNSYVDYLALSINTTLGTIAYLDDIDKKIKIANRGKTPEEEVDIFDTSRHNSLGNILFKIISDVNSYGDTSDITDEYWDKLNAKINYLVDKYHEITKEIHYFRNKLNRAPKTLQQLIDINKSVQDSKKWKMLSVSTSAFHMFGEMGIFNTKFVTLDGIYEAVYDNHLNLVTDSTNMGTYNYASPDNPVNHFIFDVQPYYKWNNTSDAVWSEGVNYPEIDVNIAALDNKTRYENSFDARLHRVQVVSLVGDFHFEEM